MHMVHMLALADVSMADTMDSSTMVNGNSRLCFDGRPGGVVEESVVLPDIVVAHHSQERNSLFVEVTGMSLFWLPNPQKTTWGDDGCCDNADDGDGEAALTGGTMRLLVRERPTRV